MTDEEQRKIEGDARREWSAMSEEVRDAYTTVYRRRVRERQQGLLAVVAPVEYSANLDAGVPEHPVSPKCFCKAVISGVTFLSSFWACLRLSPPPHCPPEWGVQSCVSLKPV